MKGAGASKSTYLKPNRYKDIQILVQNPLYKKNDQFSGNDWLQLHSGKYQNFKEHNDYINRKYQLSKYGTIYFLQAPQQRQVILAKKMKTRKQLNHIIKPLDPIKFDLYFKPYQAQQQMKYFGNYDDAENIKLQDYFQKSDFSYIFLQKRQNQNNKDKIKKYMPTHQFNLTTDQNSCSVCNSSMNKNHMNKCDLCPFIICKADKCKGVFKYFHNHDKKSIQNTVIQNRCQQIRKKQNKKEIKQKDHSQLQKNVNSQFQKGKNKFSYCQFEILNQKFKFSKTQRFLDSDQKIFFLESQQLIQKQLKFLFPKESNDKYQKKQIPRFTLISNSDVQKFNAGYFVLKTLLQSDLQKATFDFKNFINRFQDIFNIPISYVEDDDVLYNYTCEDDFHKLINMILRASDKNLLQLSYIRQPIIKIYNKVKMQYQKKPPKQNMVYRGAVQTQKHIDFFMQNQGAYIQSLGFCSTSKSIQTAEKQFLEKQLNKIKQQNSKLDNNQNFKPLLIQIQLPKYQQQTKLHLSWSSFAQITHSKFSNQNQILINILSIFEIVKCQKIFKDQKNKQLKYYLLRLKLVNLKENSQQKKQLFFYQKKDQQQQVQQNKIKLQGLLRYLKKQKQNISDIGDCFIKLGQFQIASIFYKFKLNQNVSLQKRCIMRVKLAETLKNRQMSDVAFPYLYENMKIEANTLDRLKILSKTASLIGQLFHQNNISHQLGTFWICKSLYFQISNFGLYTYEVRRCLFVLLKDYLYKSYLKWYQKAAMFLSSIHFFIFFILNICQRDPSSQLQQVELYQKVISHYKNASQKFIYLKKLKEQNSQIILNIQQSIDFCIKAIQKVQQFQGNQNLKYVELHIQLAQLLIQAEVRQFKIVKPFLSLQQIIKKIFQILNSFDTIYFDFNYQFKWQKLVLDFQQKMNTNQIFIQFFKRQQKLSEFIKEEVKYVYRKCKITQQKGKQLYKKDLNEQKAFTNSAEKELTHKEYMQAKEKHKIQMKKVRYNQKIKNRLEIYNFKGQQEKDKGSQVQENELKQKIKKELVQKQK